MSACRRFLEAACRDGDGLEGTLRIGLPAVVSHGARLIEIIAVFEEKHPECSVEVKELALSDRFEPLRQGDVDLVAGRLPLEEPDLVVGPTLSREPRVLAVAADHPLSDRAEVTTEDIADYQVVDVTGMVPPELAGVLIPEKAGSGRPMKRRRLKYHDWSELVTMIARGKIVHPTFADQFAHPGDPLRADHGYAHVDERPRVAPRRLRPAALRVHRRRHRPPGPGARLSAIRQGAGEPEAPETGCARRTM